MSAIEAALAHYEAQGRKKLVVEEWNGLEVYWTPLTLFEKRQLFKPGRPPDETIPADVLILKAQDVDGQPLFKLIDREQLMRKVDQAVATRVARRIMGEALGAADEQIAEAEKN